MFTLVKSSLARFIDFVGLLVAITMLLLLLNIFINVVMRYLFNDVSIGMQELEWHLFSCLFLFGIGYSLKENAHVRVDVIYENLGEKAQAIINIVGTLLFLVPFSALIVHYGLDFSKEAYDMNEMSGDPGGLPHRWIIKGAIPVSFMFTLLCGVYVIVEQIDLLRGNKTPHDNNPAV
ncbi:TRAP transporter small permease subunit [Psychrobium sp. 1_MG-2023]|uniref:TRAP transporter small permease subunit n=1 Tax=Psychrobium sp. 1_MG-2023 TaxID=3062624 RepID=UPI000C348203|nr:TRAP transporter small permease subunit [Psychrobium sp. 1_MG-2023]MDP2562629.1 TRAP transporter small permease subunit [Psychrobium sp. 1_MG-2023]PKF54385.1 C4-dicarboxylate ABC transporter [Alteromonadales bacterium alter-6D02]